MLAGACVLCLATPSLRAAAPVAGGPANAAPVVPVAEPAPAIPSPTDPVEQAAEAARLYGAGHYDEALPFAQRGLALIEARFGPDDTLIADFATLLGAIERSAGHMDAAAAAFERALAVDEKGFGADAPQTATGLNSLATLYLSRDEPARALPLLQRSLAIREAHLGAEAAEVSTSLSNLGSAFDALGRSQDALPLHQRALAIREKLYGSNDPRTATTLNNLAETTGALGRYREALILHRRALAIRESTLGSTHPDTTVSVGNVATLLESLGEYDEALALQKRALEADIQGLGEAHPATALTLGNLANVYMDLGRYDEAQALFERALASNTAAFGEDSLTVSGNLGSLALLAQMRGDYARALPLAERVVAMRERLLDPEHPSTAIALNNLAEVYSSMGVYGKAVELHQRAQAIREAKLGPDHPETATGLGNLATLYKALGQYDLALPLLERALQIRESTLGPESADASLSMNNLAQLFVAQKNFVRALPLERRALQIQERTLGPEHPWTATTLGNLAGVLEDMKRPREALPLQQRALAIREQVYGPRAAPVAITLDNLAALYETLGEPRRALPLYLRAFRILQGLPEPATLGAVTSRLGRWYHAHGSGELAIFYLKQSVNAAQQLRAGARSLDESAQRSFAHSVEARYRLLAELLVKRGRLTEAEQVLALLKIHERSELVRGDAQDGGSGAPLELTPAERALSEQLTGNAQKLSAAYAELEALDRDPGSTDADKRRDALSEQIQSDAETLDTLLAQASTALAASGGQKAFETALGEHDAIRSQLATLDERSGGHAAAVYFVPGERTTTFMVVTAQGAIGLTGGVGETQLNQLAAQLRTAIQQRSPDYRAPAAKLYAALLAPLGASLKSAKVDTLMLYLTGSLRYVPMAALYDTGAKKHLIEQYALAVYMVGGLRDNLAEMPATQWTAAGVGVSQALGEFPALSAVPGELQSVVHTSDDTAPTGVLAGERLLDAAFTRAELHKLALARTPYTVLHVATHFKLVPGREDQSQLLLGDGDLLSMRELRTDYTLEFRKYDLVTLSACNTSMGGGGEAGAEFEGLATTLLKKGVHAVIATLWEVQDTGTAKLMHQFYASRGAQRQRTKAEALRQAQLALLNGTIKDPDGKLDFRHPYYWAPFVLMGNWL